MTRNARFWEWINGGWVKITLRPDQSLSHYGRWKHDEGWSSEANTWSHEGRHVERTTVHDGRDCDGRLTQQFVSECYLEYLRRYPAYVGDVTCPPVQCYGYVRAYIPDCMVLDGDIRLPCWEPSRSWMRDEYAEAAGY